MNQYNNLVKEIEKEFGLEDSRATSREMSIKLESMLDSLDNQYFLERNDLITLMDELNRKRKALATLKTRFDDSMVQEVIKIDKLIETERFNFKNYAWEIHSLETLLNYDFLDVNDSVRDILKKHYPEVYKELFNYENSVSFMQKKYGVDSKTCPEGKNSAYSELIKRFTDFKKTVFLLYKKYVLSEIEMAKVMLDDSKKKIDELLLKKERLGRKDAKLTKEMEEYVQKVLLLRNKVHKLDNKHTADVTLIRKRYNEMLNTEKEKESTITQNIIDTFTDTGDNWRNFFVKNLSSASVWHVTLVNNMVCLILKRAFWDLINHNYSDDVYQELVNEKEIIPLCNSIKKDDSISLCFVSIIDGHLSFMIPELQDEMCEYVMSKTMEKGKKLEKKKSDK